MGSGSAEFEIVVHKNDTIDLKYTASIEGVNPSLYCTDEALKESTTIPNAKAEIVGNTCTVKATSVPLETLNNETTTLKHEGKKYVYRAKSGPGNLSQQSSFKFTISMTFPGKVQKADGGGEIKGNKVTWTNPPEEGFGAEASDGSSSVMIWVLLGLVVLLVIVAVVVILVVVSKRKKPTPPAGMYPQPGAPQPQPGYGAGQPVAGTPYVQPQAYQQPGYSQPQGGQAPGSSGYGY